MLTGWCIKSRTVLCKSFRVADTTATSRAVAALASGKATWQNLTPAFYLGKSKLGGVLAVATVTPYCKPTEASQDVITDGMVQP